MLFVTKQIVLLFYGFFFAVIKVLVAGTTAAPVGGIAGIVLMAFVLSRKNNLEVLWTQPTLLAQEKVASLFA